MAETTKKPRAKRRNYEKELRDITAYCQVSLDIYLELAQTPDERIQGKISAFRSVLAKLGVTP